jgi:hypothetical protein
MSGSPSKPPTKHKFRLNRKGFLVTRHQLVGNTWIQVRRSCSIGSDRLVILLFALYDYSLQSLQNTSNLQNQPPVAVAQGSPTNPPTANHSITVDAMFNSINQKYGLVSKFGINRSHLYWLLRYLRSRSRRVFGRSLVRLQRKSGVELRWPLPTFLEGDIFPRVL